MVLDLQVEVDSRAQLWVDLQRKTALFAGAGWFPSEENVEPLGIFIQIHPKSGMELSPPAVLSEASTRIYFTS